jgi:predicted O-methyltransferase YrrM
MWKLRQAWYFIGYLLRAKPPAQIHSPFLFELLQFIHDPARQYYVFDAIEILRKQLTNWDEELAKVDYGAGTKVKGKRTVKQVTQTSLSDADKCQTVFRLLVHQKPRIILELGTCLGIMTAYLASAQDDTQVHTLEGNPSLLAIAHQIAQHLDLKNIRFHEGRFLDTLPELLKSIGKIDFVLIDGDHRGEALKNYFTMIKPHLSENAIVMIDDIRWSADMYQAWKEILLDPDLTCSLDYFSFGVLFFRKDFLERVHLSIRV